MKTTIKETKRNTYLNYGGEIFSTNRNFENPIFTKVNFSELEKQQSEALKSEFGWREIGDYETIEQAYSAYATILGNDKESRKKENAEFAERVTREKNDAWASISELKIIPSTIENIKILLQHLNEQNWGSWTLPTMSIGYSAHQYDCDGTTATTIALDQPIDGENKFKVGGKFGHLNNYKKI